MRHARLALALLALAVSGACSAADITGSPGAGRTHSECSGGTMGSGGRC